MTAPPRTRSPSASTRGSGSCERLAGEGRRPYLIPVGGASAVGALGYVHAADELEDLRERGLDELIRSLTQPVLGVCLGMQLLCEHSEENDTPCLGIIPQKVMRFRPKQGEKVPHMGWNSIHTLKDGVFTPDLEEEYVYFVHSYFVEVGPYTTATTDYIHPFSSGLRKDNFFATQFHPEKSGKVGEAILRNFLTL